MEVNHFWHDNDSPPLHTYTYIFAILRIVYCIRLLLCVGRFTGNEGITRGITSLLNIRVRSELVVLEQVGISLSLTFTALITYFFSFTFFFFLINEWEHRMGTLCPSSSLYPWRKGSGRQYQVADFIKTN